MKCVATTIDPQTGAVVACANDHEPWNSPHHTYKRPDGTFYHWKVWPTLAPIELKPVDIGAPSDPLAAKLDAATRDLHAMTQDRNHLAGVLDGVVKERDAALRKLGAPDAINVATGDPIPGSPDLDWVPELEMVTAKIRQALVCLRRLKSPDEAERILVSALDAVDNNGRAWDCGDDTHSHQFKGLAQACMTKHALEKAERARESAPIPMRLHCPACGELHVDAGAFATKVHHTHSCQKCGLTWRPAVVPTVGVRFLPGFKDAP